MIEVSKLASSNIEESAELLELASEARAFLLAHKWCKEVREGFFDRGFSKVAVFLFQIDPAPPADPEVWVIVGDLPPAYIDTQTCPNGAAALDGYVGAVREWAEAVLSRQGTHGLIPIVKRGSLEPLQPSADLAQLLLARMDFIDRELLAGWADELDTEVGE